MWTDNLETQLSQSRSICFWKECPISWNSKKQKNITLSSNEAELNALSNGVLEKLWIKYLAKEPWNEKPNPSMFHVDNKGLVEKNDHFGPNSKTKYLDIKIKWLCNIKKNNEIIIMLIPSEEMVADTLTKTSNTKLLRM